MKTLISTLILGAGLVFGNLNSFGQTQRDSTKFCVYGTNKDSVLEIKYVTNPSTHIKKIKTMYKKNKDEYYKITSKSLDEMDKKMNGLKEENFNLFIYTKNYWASPGEYVYDKDLNLIRGTIMKGIYVPDKK